jgi:hypothetical protein
MLALRSIDDHAAGEIGDRTGECPFVERINLRGVHGGFGSCEVFGKCVERVDVSPSEEEMCAFARESPRHRVSHGSGGP